MFWRSGERPTDARPEVQPNRDAVGRTLDWDPHGSDFERRKRVAAVGGVLVALAIAACGGGGPTGPTPTPRPVSVSITASPNPVGVGEQVCTTVRLSRPLSRAVTIYILRTSPNFGDADEPWTASFPVGVTVRRGNHGEGGVPTAGDWTDRILGDRLPDGVVLGSPSSATTTVLPPPFASGVDCLNQN